MDCFVCCEVSSKHVTCGCGFSACQACTKKYILGSFEDAQCMSCKRAFSREDLVRGLGKTFVTDAYKKHREHVLFDRERAMLPATQARLPLYRRCIQIERSLTVRTVEYRDLTAQIRELKKKADDLKRRIEYDKVIVQQIKTNAYEPQRPRRTTTAAEPEQEPARVLCGCPSATCNGFVLTSDYACGACGTAVCDKCHAPKTDGHVCAPGAIETAKAILKETKPCPRCNVPIFKSSGCYQMFCTQCQCVFDWANGREITSGVVHNPHYFEWLNARGGGGDAVAAPVNCGGFRTAYAVLHALPRGLPAGWRDDITRRVRTAGHMEDVEMRAIRPRDHVRDNTVLRLRYLNGDLTEAQFKTALQRAEKKRARDDELRQLLAMYVTVVQTTINNIPLDGATIDHVRDARMQLDALDTYVTNQLSRLNEVFSTKSQSLYQYFIVKKRNDRATERETGGLTFGAVGGV